MMQKRADQMKSLHSRLGESGFFVVSLVVTMTFMFLISISVFNLIINNYGIAVAERYRVNAQLAADAGADAGISELNVDPDWTGTSGEVDLFTDPSGDFKTTYEATVTDVADSNKVLAVTGRTYVPATSTTARSTRSISVDLRGIGDATGSFAIVTGVGGLVMENNAKIVAGDVHVNGTITMSNKTQIGTTTNALNVDVAHFSCPAGGGVGYPSQCGSSDGEPISISNQAKIYGDVCATNQVDGGSMVDNGLDTTCSDPPPLALPTHVRQDQKDNVSLEAGVDTSNPLTYYTSCIGSSLTRTWEGRLKIDGDVVIGQQCEVTITGDVWITGDLTLSNQGKLIVDDSITLGDPNTVNDDYPTIMVDGAGGIQFLNNSEVLGNSSNVGIQFITYWSEASCSPDCTDVTGQDLYDSSDDATIYLEQNAEANNSILYAKWSKVDLNNGGDIGALVGQTILLRNSASVTFGATISDPMYTGPPPIWLLDHYRRTF